MTTLPPVNHAEGVAAARHVLLSLTQIRNEASELLEGPNSPDGAEYDRFESAMLDYINEPTDVRLVAMGDAINRYLRVLRPYMQPTLLSRFRMRINGSSKSR